MLKCSRTFSTIRTPPSYPASCMRYLSGSTPDLRVPYREVALSATRHSDRTEENLPLPVAAAKPCMGSIMALLPERQRRGKEYHHCE